MNTLKGKYPSEFNKHLTEKIRKRDNYQCKICGITQEEHLKIYEKILCVHHMDGNKQNCEENNLITLCWPCNNAESIGADKMILPRRDPWKIHKIYAKRKGITPAQRRWSEDTR